MARSYGLVSFNDLFSVTFLSRISSYIRVDVTLKITVKYFFTRPKVSGFFATGESL